MDVLSKPRSKIYISKAKMLTKMITKHIKIMGVGDGGQR